MTSAPAVGGGWGTCMAATAPTGLATTDARPTAGRGGLRSTRQGRTIEHWALESRGDLMLPSAACVNVSRERFAAKIG